MYRILKIVVCALLFYPMLHWALPEDKAQTIHIDADSTTFNYKTKMSTYEGNVHVSQGSSNLLADYLTTKSNAEHKMEEAIAYGRKKPAEYWTIPHTGDKPLHAKANVIKFYPIKSLIYLEGNVVVSQGENNFHGPYIIYNIKDQLVTAPASKNGRASIVIQPDQLKS